MLDQGLLGQAHGSTVFACALLAAMVIHLGSCCRNQHLPLLLLLGPLLLPPLCWAQDLQRLKPRPLIYLNTTEGAELLRKASHSQPYLHLAAHFATELPGMCGPTTAVMLLNALCSQGLLEAPISEEYSAHLKGHDFTQHYWEQHNIWNASERPTGCVARATQPWIGALEQVAALLSCRGARVQAQQATDATSLAAFRSAIVAAFERSPPSFVAVNFDRQIAGQTGFGHHSPLGAYDAASDRALLLDVARYRYPPSWIPLERLLEAMQRHTKPPVPMPMTPRGFLVVSGPDRVRAGGGTASLVSLDDRQLLV